MMRRCGTSLLVLVIVAGSLAAQRKTEEFDSRWRFHLGDAPGAQDVAFDDAAWRSLLEEHHSLVRQELGAHRGREVNTSGDGFLARFDSPALAIRCAKAIRAKRVVSAFVTISAGFRFLHAE